MKIILISITSVLILNALVVFAPQLASAGSLAQTAGEGQTIFQQKCTSCHTIGGGKLVGPDLQGVTQRRDMAWLQRFIQRPDQMIASGDPVAVQLLAENNNVQMPNLNLSQNEVAALIAYLENPATTGAAAPVVLPPGNAATGKALFTGATAFSGGGLTCMACHNVSGTGITSGGGSLGPDLTHVYSRLGEQGLASNLNAIVFPTMQGVFLNKPLTLQEQSDLIAYFRDADAAPPVVQLNYTLFFLAAGILISGSLFFVMLFFWPRQRKPLSEQLRSAAPRARILSENRRIS